MTIKPLTLSNGSTFEHKGIRYTVIKTDGDDYNLAIDTGRFAIGQNFYLDGNEPTIDYIEYILDKYL